MSSRESARVTVANVISFCGASLGIDPRRKKAGVMWISGTSVSILAECTRAARERGEHDRVEEEKAYCQDPFDGASSSAFSTQGQ